MKFSKERAKEVDLIVLPKDIDGTNCGNCIHFEPDRAYCNEDRVQMNVNERMCCFYWSRHDAPIAESATDGLGESKYNGKQMVSWIKTRLEELCRMVEQHEAARSNRD